ncbi:transposase [Allorhodopirellula heiligendammensis]|uniref:Transposase IS200 like protein n=1 Tax=Allorhodopirellula heiligendammensis TaxID=2714739 RepID=A0A5C6BVS9_9BACT|nr:transposase [Allorhodopirellula heiligendammensis]TWU16390.1 Transposase IS200 like protein [Allorhodopirellula heiligendammensis]
MPRPPRADEANGLYHALNRGNLRNDIFHKDADFAAFERVLHEALQIFKVELFCYQLMHNHYHLVLRPLIDGEMSRFMGWVGGTHTMRYHAHYHTSGLGHVYQQRYKSFPIQDDDHFFIVCRYVERNALRAGLVTHAENWRWGSLWRWLQSPEPNPQLLSAWPIPRRPRWVQRVNEPLDQHELAAVQLSAQRGRPFGEEGWVETTARRLNLESTMRPRGRQKVRVDLPERIKEA